MSRFRLVTFGTLELRDSAGPPLPGDGPQRRRLALLAVLAASGDRGCSRDWLQALFWPEASQQRARHSLEQVLYAMRSSLHESLFVGVSPLRLNPEAIESDVAEFDLAVAETRFADAAALYTGPFLDGFHLGDAPEFERWLDGSRDRLAGAYRSSLERLAREAAAGGDPNRAADWWRRLAAADPLDSRTAEELIRALIAVGDRVAALRYAEGYAALVAKELETSVSPAIDALTAGLRQPPTAARQPRRTPAPIAVAHSADRTAPSAGATEIPTSAPALRKRSGAIAAALVLLALVAAGAWGAWRATDGRDSDRRATATELAPASIAVLPFRVAGSNSADAALADGLTHELTGAMAGVGLIPVAVTSVYALRETALDVRQLADTLRADHLLEGSISRSGQRARVHVRLIDGRSGAIRWSSDFDLQLGDWFDLQQEVATAVATELGVRLADSSRRILARRPTASVAAYDLSLRGQDQALFRSDSGLQRRLSIFQQAVALDSNFAAAHAGLAYSYNALALRGVRRRGQIEDLLLRAAAAAHRAIALDSTLAEGHAALGSSSLIGLRDLRTAERHLRRATELPTPSRAREHLVFVYIALGRPEEALAHAQRAVEADPLSPTAAAELAHALLASRRCDEALQILRPLEHLNPPMPRVALYVAQCHGMQSRWDEALRTLPPGGGPRFRAWRVVALARGGHVAEARREMAELEALALGGGASDFDLATAHLGLRQREEAIRHLERSVDELTIGYEVMEPLFEELHSHPRFDALRKRWLPAGDWLDSAKR